MPDFEDAYFNIYKEGEKIFIESTCKNIEELVARSKQPVSFEHNGELCRVSFVSIKNTKDAVNFLANIGVDKTRIAVENEPLDVDVDTVFSKEPKALICPICGSSNVVIINVAGLLPPVYRCLNCGYVGRIVLLAEPKKKA